MSHVMHTRSHQIQTSDNEIVTNHQDRTFKKKSLGKRYIVYFKLLPWSKGSRKISLRRLSSILHQVTSLQVSLSWRTQVILRLVSDMFCIGKSTDCRNWIQITHFDRDDYVKNEVYLESFHLCVQYYVQYCDWIKYDSSRDPFINGSIWTRCIDKYPSSSIWDYDIIHWIFE